MSNPLPHISVCICTYRRPALLRRTLECVCSQDAQNAFTWSVVVADNDALESGRVVVEEMAASAPIPVTYCVEREQGIAKARNTVVAHATGEFLAFIDDDEFAPADWLLTLFRFLRANDAAAGVLGPVNPHFEQGAPRWIVEGRFYDRPVLPSGTQLPWIKCRTGNVLLKREILQADAQPFNPECLSGEDQDFFRRKTESGCTFLWCHEAPAYEVVPPVRWKRGFLLRRALFRGMFAQRNHGVQPLRLLQALVSMPAYALLLPVALAFGQAKFMLCLFKISYHAGRILGLFRINPIRQQYVVE